MNDFNWPTPEPAPTAEPDTDLAPAPAPAPVSRAELVRSVMVWDRVAAKAKDASTRLRDQLAATARKELAEQGTAPTWRLSELAIVSLPVSREAVVVNDPAALLKWVAANHPTEVEHVEQVRPAYLSALLDTATPADEVACTADGEVIPGLAVRPGGIPGTLTVRVDKDARMILDQAAADILDAVASALGEPIGLEPTP